MGREASVQSCIRHFSGRSKSTPLPFFHDIDAVRYSSWRSKVKDDARIVDVLPRVAGSAGDSYRATEVQPR